MQTNPPNNRKAIDVESKSKTTTQRRREQIAANHANTICPPKAQTIRMCFLPHGSPNRDDRIYLLWCSGFSFFGHQRRRINQTMFPHSSSPSKWNERNFPHFLCGHGTIHRSRHNKRGITEWGFGWFFGGQQPEVHSFVVVHLVFWANRSRYG